MNSSTIPTPGIATTSELNNLLQIIGGTTELLENIWEGTQDSERYLRMLRTSVARAAKITAQIVEQAGGVGGKVLVAPPVPELPAEPQTRKRRIMLVDDEPIAVELFREILAMAGYEIVAAGSGFEALDKFVRSDSEIDLVILDLNMPFMDGEETFRRMHLIKPNVPIVLSTGLIGRERLDSMFAAGLAGFMSKPLPPDEILEQIAAILFPHPAEASAESGTAAAL